MKRQNFLVRTDAYKMTHWLQYPEKTQHVYSYLESRGGMFNDTVFFGLQYYINEYLSGPVFNQTDIEEAEAFSGEVFGHTRFFNRKGWQHILNKHGGHLPMYICAVPEGSVIPTRNVLMTMVNTDPAVPWLTNCLETLLLKVWYPTTVSTLSYHIRKLIDGHAIRTGSRVSPYHLNDFGYRGVSSEESAAIGGAAHLVCFSGTDTLAGIDLAKKHYNAKISPGHSVMASEHSTTTIYGRDGELEAFGHFLDACPTGIISIVVDSYNTYRAVGELLGTKLKDRILARDGKVVIRPDSGVPEHMSVACLNLLDQSFGHTVNDAGFKVLNPKVGVIYGDGINYNSIGDILACTTGAGYCTDNIVFGMGGGLLQQVNRDTQQFAIKCSAAMVDGEWRDVFKDPADGKAKSSKKGRLKLVVHEGSHGIGYATKPWETPTQDFVTHDDDDLLVPYPLNNEGESMTGTPRVDNGFEAIRGRAMAGTLTPAVIAK